MNGPVRVRTFRKDFESYLRRTQMPEHRDGLQRAPLGLVRMHAPTWLRTTAQSVESVRLVEEASVHPSLTMYIHGIYPACHHDSTATKKDRYFTDRTMRVSRTSTRTHT